MTPKLVHAKIKSMWPGSAAAKPDWETQYHEVLRPYEEHEIERAWNRWHSDPPHDHPPKPHELAKLVQARRRLGAPQQSTIATPEIEDDVDPIMSDRQLQDVVDQLEQLYQNGTPSGTALEDHTATKLISLGEGIIDRHFAAVQASEAR